MKTFISYVVLTILLTSVSLAGSTPPQSNKDHHKNAAVCLKHHKHCQHDVQPPDDANGNGGGTVVDPIVVSINGTSAPFLAMPDKATVFDIIQVNSLLKIKSIVVNVDITHSYIGDLVLILRHNGTQSVLLNQRGGYLQNLNLTFDDTSLTPIGSLPMVVPVIGTYQPETSLNVFNDLPAGGDWTLEVVDSFVGDTGTLNAWSVLLETY